MKCYGYSKKDSDTLLEMTEITFQADPIKLRKVADFLYECAKNIENDSEWEHGHLQDSKYYEQISKDNFFDLIVYNEGP